MPRSAAFALISAIIVICLLRSFTALAAKSPATRPVVVVELFTSEGCSSCPPADAVLADLAKPDAVAGVQIVPLSLHVDYWNSQGWADRFSSAQFSDRQREYARIYKSDEIYTPQMIVDGTDQFIGSDRQRANAAIATAAAGQKGSVDIAVKADSKGNAAVACRIDGVQRSKDSSADVMLAITEDDLSTNVPRGENAGRTLHSTAVVRTLRRIATINPADALPFSASAAVNFLPAWRADHLHMVIFVQDPRTGKILAAGTRQLANGRAA